MWERRSWIHEACERDSEMGFGVVCWEVCFLTMGVCWAWSCEVGECELAPGRIGETVWGKVNIGGSY